MLVQLEPIGTATIRAANAVGPCSHECSQGTGRQRTSVHRHSQPKQGARYPACAGPKTCNWRVTSRIQDGLATHTL
jgi:hypothetical protein